MAVFLSGLLTWHPSQQKKLNMWSPHVSEKKIWVPISSFFSKTEGRRDDTSERAAEDVDA
jgi:hypothetical protein